MHASDPGTCPRCKLAVAVTRQQSYPAVCDNCGFVMTASEKAVHQSLERTLLKSAGGVSVVIVAAFLYFGTWGSYSFEVVPLKVGEYMHTNSAADMERLAQIGMDLRKVDLVEKQYRLLAQQVDAKYFARLGKFQVAHREYREAAETYRQYFALGKHDWEARIDYARALGEIGMIDEAAKNFDYVLAARPGVRQVTVIQNYVTMLVKNERFDQAKRVIDHIREHDPDAAKFMDTEYKVISARSSRKS